MALKKKAPQQLSAAANGQNTQKGVENLARKSREPVNHWAILDQIEAPMWADLTRESDSTYENKFHQCSARQLIAAFSHRVEHRMNSDVQGPSSPKLPPSVSKSRGKDYNSRKQEPVGCRFSLNKQHQIKSLSNKSSSINVGFEKAIENNALDGKVNDQLNYTPVSVDEGTLAETTSLVLSESVSSFSDKKTSAKSVALGGGESNSTSTITSEATERKLIEVSSQPFGPTIGLLSTLRVSLRKSYATRQASRGEIKGTRQPEGTKSSSSKSSVGSSLYPRCEGMNLSTTENMDKTPDNRNIMSMSQLPTNKVNRAIVQKAPAGQVHNMSCKSNLSINREAKKAMENKKHKEAYVTRRANECIPPETAMNSMRARGINHSSIGKENQAGKIVLTTKSSSRMKDAEGSVINPKVVKRKVHQKSDRTKLVGPRESCSRGSEVKKSIRMVETVYFR